MPLTPGTLLGPYEIVAPIGAGGMGEVYRARDTRLGRDVAVKVLPAHLSLSAEVRARFEREARTISSLNHPNICTLFDVGREGDTDYLVMELVEGETLADRLEKGELPPADALRIGMQIADALDRAHRAGIVHRDLKPGNIMLARSNAKLMDFGLARATGMAGPASGSGVTIAALTHSPTVAQPLTTEGTLVGTFVYMSPEQLEGKEADARSDIWALGCVLYEMATGRRPFSGKSQASLITSIMGTEPAPIAQVAPMSPPGLDRLVRACLAKDPEERIQTAHDVKLQLQWVAEGGSQAGVPAPVAAKRRRREGLAWALFAVAALAAVALGVLQLMPKPRANSVVFELTPPPHVGAVDLPRISPDGRQLAFNATDSTGVTGVWVRALSSLEARHLPGTEGATRPFWSPDSRYLAFFSGGKLRKIDIAGGPPQVVCDAPRGADGTWGKRGVILFDGSSADTVQRVSAGGGVATGATALNRAAGESFTAWPQFLPDGRHFLYLAYDGAGERTLKVGDLESKTLKSLGPAGSRTEYASGHLLFVRQGALLAQPFDLGGLKLKGDPFPIAENVEYDVSGSARFSASSQGTLVYRAGGANASRKLTWVDRTGRTLGTIGAPGLYDDPAFSLDGKQLAVRLASNGGQSGDIWIWDLSRDLGSRFTFAATDVNNATWSPDGARIVYSLAQPGGVDLRIKPLGGAGADSVLYASKEEKYASCWSQDGRYLAYISRSGFEGQRWDIRVLPMTEPGKPIPVVATPANESGPAFSPDGKWLLYSSDESGQSEVYVQAFPGPGGKSRVSTQGGREPMWRGDGREIYYLTSARQLMAAAFEPGMPPRLGLPSKLFDAPVIRDTYVRNRYQPSPDGQKFLLNKIEGETQVGATTVVLDWLGNLQKR